jgi:hypothetical protein
MDETAMIGNSRGAIESEELAHRPERLLAGVSGGCTSRDHVSTRRHAAQKGPGSLAAPAATGMAWETAVAVIVFGDFNCVPTVT